MQLLILHLSDMHFSKQKFPDEKLNALVRAIKTHKEATRIIICITGDIAFSGIGYNYKIASQFLSRLVNELKKIIIAAYPS